MVHPFSRSYTRCPMNERGTESYRYVVLVECRWVWRHRFGVTYDMSSCADVYCVLLFAELIPSSTVWFSSLTLWHLLLLLTRMTRPSRKKIFQEGDDLFGCKNLRNRKDIFSSIYHKNTLEINTWGWTYCGLTSFLKVPIEKLWNGWFLVSCIIPTYL